MEYAVKRYLSVAAGALLLLAPIACGGDSGPIGPEPSVAGTYTLRTVDGAPIPVTLSESGTYRLEVIGGRIVLDPEDTFATFTEFRETRGTEVSIEPVTVVGSYVVNGSNISMTNAATGGVVIANHAAGTLTLVDAGLTIVYRR